MELVQHVFPIQAELAAIRGAALDVSRSKDRKVKKHASHSDSTNPDRRGCPPVAGESFHPHGRKYQVDLECGGSHRSCVVAPQRIWTVPLPLANPRWLASVAERTTVREFSDHEQKSKIGRNRRTMH